MWALLAELSVRQSQSEDRATDPVFLVLRPSPWWSPARLTKAVGIRPRLASRRAADEKLRRANEIAASDLLWRDDSSGTLRRNRNAVRRRRQSLEERLGRRERVVRPQNAPRIEDQP